LHPRKENTFCCAAHPVPDAPLSHALAQALLKDLKTQIGVMQEKMDSGLNGMQQQMDAGFKDLRSDVGVLRDTTSGLVEYSARKEVSEQCGRITPAVVCSVEGVCKLVGVAPSKAAKTLVVRAACAAALREVRPSRALAQRGVVRAVWH
jgi:hypothetical protein